MNEIASGVTKTERVPPYLKADKNLYAQAPFQQIIENTLLESPGFTGEEIATLISRLAGFAKRHRSTAQSAEELAEKMKAVDLHAVYSDVNRYLGFKDDRRGEVCRVITDVLLPKLNLEKYSFWYEYVENRTGPGECYKPDGTPQKGRVKDGETESFEYWHPRRQITKGKVEHTFVGINEVFPQTDLGGLKQ